MILLGDGPGQRLPGVLREDFRILGGCGLIGNGLKNRLFVRRLRLEVAGEIMKRIQWTVQVEFGGMPLEISYKGVVSPVEIKMTIDFMGMPFDFLVKKAP